MAERVETGGVMSFKYGKGHSPKMSEEQRKEIAEAYKNYEKRKQKEKNIRMIIILVSILTLLTLGYFLFRILIN